MKSSAIKGGLISILILGFTLFWTKTEQAGPVVQATASSTLFISTRIGTSPQEDISSTAASKVRFIACDTPIGGVVKQISVWVPIVLMVSSLIINPAGRLIVAEPGI